MRELLLDVDGVVADFIQGVLDLVDYPLRRQDIKQWDMLALLPFKDKKYVLGELKKPEFWEGLPIMEGAQEGVLYLENVGYSITWLTSPWASCYGWESARRNWLNHHFQMRAKGHNYIPTSAKDKVDGDALVDDKPENVIGWSLAHPGKKTFLFDAPYNQEVTGHPRLTWATVKSCL